MCSPVEVIFAITVENFSSKRAAAAACFTQKHKTNQLTKMRTVLVALSLACVVAVAVATTELDTIDAEIAAHRGQLNALKQRLSADTKAKLAIELSATKTCVDDQRAGCIGEAALTKAGAAQSMNSDPGKPARCSNIITSQLVKGPGSKSCAKTSCPDGIGHGGFFYETDAGAFCGSWASDAAASQTAYCKAVATKNGPAGKKDLTCTRAMVDHPDQTDAGIVMLGLKRMACTYNSAGVQDCRVFKTGKCFRLIDPPFGKAPAPSWVNPVINRKEVKNLSIDAQQFHNEKKAAAAKVVALLRKHNNDLTKVDADAAVTKCLYPPRHPQASGTSQAARAYKLEVEKIENDNEEALSLLQLL